MTKQKKQSFVEMQKEDNNEENIINPLNQYKYIEPKKKLPIKKILLTISIIIVMILMILFFKLMDIHTENINKQIDSNNTQNTKNNPVLLTTTTTTTTTINKIDEITETLTCTSSNFENNLQIETTVIANFHNKKLRSDINQLKIKLLDINSKEYFDNYVNILKAFYIYLLNDSNYEVTSDIKEDEFNIYIKTTYQKDKSFDSDLSYDEEYESVKQKLIELGHTCK